MDENPFKSPQADSPSLMVKGVQGGSVRDLRSVAMFQKGVQVCILVYLGAIFGQFALPPEIRSLVAGAVVLIAGLGGAVFVILLAVKVYNPAIGVLMGILALVPCIGLLVLLVINGKATNILKDNGFRVGLLGADLSQFDRS